MTRMLRCGVARYDMVKCDVMCYGVLLMIWCAVVWYDMIMRDMTCCGVPSHDMVCRGVV